MFGHYRNKGATAFSIQVFSIATLSIMTLSIMTLSIRVSKS